MTGGDDLPQDLRDFCFSFAGKSLDGAAGTQRRQKVAWRGRWHAATL